MNYKVFRSASDINPDKWEKFVTDHPDGNVFHSPGFYNSCLNTKKYSPLFFALEDTKGFICGIFLAVVQRDYFFPISYLTRRAIVFGGPLVKNNDLSILDLLLKEVDKLCKKKSIFIQFRNFVQQPDNITEIYANNDYTYNEHLNILIDLTVGKEALWRGVKRNRKDGINKAKKQPFTFEVNDKLDDLDDFYNLLKDTYENIKVPFPDISFFKSLNQELNGILKWFILKHEDMPVVTLASFVYKGVIYAFYIGITRDNTILNLRPVDLFYWNVLDWGVNNDMKFFDWMGAGSPNKDYGVRKFKLQYGGESIEMGRYEKKYSPLFYHFASKLYEYKKKVKF